MLFSISKTKSRSWQSFFYTKNEYNKIVRSTDYLNWCKVLYVYVDIILTVCCISLTKSNTRMGYERCSRFFKKTLARRQSIVLVHLIRSSVIQLPFSTSK